jgi:hypothetical protein
MSLRRRAMRSSASRLRNRASEAEKIGPTPLADFFNSIGPKAKPENVRLHVGYWGAERNCCKWDQSVAVDPSRP